MNLRVKLAPLIHGAMQTMLPNFESYADIAPQNHVDIIPGTNKYKLKLPFSSISLDSFVTTFISEIYITIMTTFGNTIILRNGTFILQYVYLAITCILHVSWLTAKLIASIEHLDSRQLLNRCENWSVMSGWIQIQYTLRCTVLECTTLYWIVVHCTELVALSWVWLHCAGVYCTVLYFTALYYTLLHCTILYCTVLQFPVLYFTFYWPNLHRQYHPDRKTRVSMQSIPSHPSEKGKCQFKMLEPSRINETFAICVGCYWIMQQVHWNQFWSSQYITDSINTTISVTITMETHYLCTCAYSTWNVSLTGFDTFDQGLVK